MNSNPNALLEDCFKEFDLFQAYSYSMKTIQRMNNYSYNVNYAMKNQIQHIS